MNRIKGTHHPLRRLGAGAAAAALTIGLTATGASAAPVTRSRPAATAARTAALACPAPPKAPARSTAYKLAGVRWNPSHTIVYYVARRNTGSTLAARVADVRKAMRAAAKASGLVVRYGGTRATAPASPKFFTIDFGFTTNPYLQASKPYVLTVNGVDTAQLIAASVTLYNGLVPGYGPYVKGALPEGHFLLQYVANSFGLKTVKRTYREVMNPTVSAAHYAESYQAGDLRGLYEVGSVKGCTGFRR